MALWRVLAGASALLLVTGVLLQVVTVTISVKAMQLSMVLEGVRFDGSADAMGLLMSRTLLHGAPFTQYQLGRVYRDYVNVHKCGATIPPPLLPRTPTKLQRVGNDTAPNMFRLEPLVVTRTRGSVNLVICSQVRVALIGSERR